MMCCDCFSEVTYVSRHKRYNIVCNVVCLEYSVFQLSTFNRTEPQSETSVSRAETSDSMPRRNWSSNRSLSTKKHCLLQTLGSTTNVAAWPLAMIGLLGSSSISIQSFQWSEITRIERGVISDQNLALERRKIE
jgi:hypothetical protein